jgi:formylmethanofuran dehydrogenase subunit C
MNVGHEEKSGTGEIRSTAVNGGFAANFASRFENGTGRIRYCTAILISMMIIAGAFAAIPVRAAGPATVNLGTAGDYVVLAKTGISMTGTTDITGNIGISPAAASYITGFDLTMDSSNEFSTSSVVTGKVYASDYTPPTPTKMTTAVSDMETAFTDAAGRAADYTELHAGDVTGQTLTPGCYKWDTGLLISDGGVTISGAASDVWIFQIAQRLMVANGAIITLSGGAKATNIFWQVAGDVILGTTAQMKGIILCQNQITMDTGATLVGRALAQTAVTLDANVVTLSTVVSPPDGDTSMPQSAWPLLLLAVLVVLAVITMIIYSSRRK